MLAFQPQLAVVSQLPGKAALWGLFAALLKVAEMAFLGVLQVSEESSSVQAVNQNPTLLVLHIPGLRGTWEGVGLFPGLINCRNGDSSGEIVSGGIHVGKPGIIMMPLLINNR